jgi:Cdc6-like AAA superfamily ATPase
MFSIINKKWLLPFIILSTIGMVILSSLKLTGYIKSYYSLFILIALFVIVSFMGILLFLPKEYGRQQLRRASLFITTGFCSLIFYLFKNSDLITATQKLLIKKYPKLPHIIPLNDVALIAGFASIFIVLTFLHYCIRDFSALKTHESSFDEEFPEKEFKERLRSFCRVLENQLNQLDIDTNWSDAHFTPLEAEVEVWSGNKKTKRITNLLSAIKKDNRSNTFLVLGDPGSGKSVALRKLSRDLLKEVSSKFRIPIYINLKEWQVIEKWTEENPPTNSHLYNFVISSLKGKDVFADEFIDKYFKRLLENGHVFFIFDSFDEIPAVLDVNESSWLIDKLSLIIYQFMAGAHDSRGILASRVFRRPSSYFQSKTILDIRPFSELKISQALKKYISFDQHLIDVLFKERQELIPIASNPFSVGLIYNYAKDNNNKLPKNQAELYSSYINKRLEICNDKIIKNNLSNDLIIKCAIEIANFMFNKENLGLEANIIELKSEFRKYPIEAIIEVLVYARIGRLGRGEESRFSFVHRRFNEYFVVRRLIEKSEAVKMDSIPSDSRYRDALVLYCEVANLNEAVAIAEYCWNEIKLIENISINSPQYLRAIHCLRFLKEAYRTRLDCLNSFRSDLTLLIQVQINEYKKSGNILFVKLAIEAIGLVEPKDIQNLLINAFALQNTWINDTAIKSCRHLSKLDTELEKKIIRYINSLDTKTFLRRKDELLFSLKLSEGFKKVYSICRIKNYDAKLALICIILLSFFEPVVSFISLLFYYFETYLNLLFSHPLLW